MTTGDEFDAWLTEADENFVQLINAETDRAAVLHAVQRAAAERASKELVELVAVAAVTGAPPEQAKRWSGAPTLITDEPQSPDVREHERPSSFGHVRAEHNHDMNSLLQQASEGAREAIVRVLHTVRPLVVRYCRAQVGQHEGTFAVADDLAQEICLAVLVALPNAQGQYQNFLRIVYGIAAQQVRSTRAELPCSYLRKPVWNLPIWSQRCPSELPAGSLAERLSCMLGALPDIEREVVVLRVVVGLSVADTSEMVGQSASWVRDKQHCALAMLRNLFATGECNLD